MSKHYLISQDPVTATGVCEACGPVKLNRKGFRSGMQLWRCQSGQNEAKKLYKKKAKVITSEHMELLSAAQHNLCEICKQLPNTFGKLVIDHDHTSGKFRGLLCATCNSGLGLLKDSSTILLAAAEYLKKHNK